MSAPTPRPSLVSACNNTQSLIALAYERSHKVHSLTLSTKDWESLYFFKEYKKDVFHVSARGQKCL